MTLATILMLLTMAGLLVLSAFFSGTETALFSLTRHQQLQLQRGEGGVALHAIVALLRDTRSLLITLLMGNMVVNVLYFTICPVVILRLVRTFELNGYIAAAMSVFPLLLIVLCGEVLPKLIAARAAAAWSGLVAVPMLLVHRGITPIRVVAQLLVITPLARLIAPDTGPTDLTADELETMLTLSQRHGTIDPNEEQLLQQVLELSQLKVKDLMIPRVDVEAFDLNDPPDRLIELIRKRRLRHVPAYTGDLDHVDGLLRSREVLLHRPRHPNALRQMVRPVRFVPELQRADRLLMDLRERGETFAIVVDEYGGTAGLITLEDLIEHMVGDIPGEYETVGDPEVKQVGPGRFLVGAELPIHDWHETFGRTLGNSDTDRAMMNAVSTVGGLVMARLGRVPREGDRVELGGVTIRVREMDGHRVRRVLIQTHASERAGTADSPDEGVPS